MGLDRKISILVTAKSQAYELRIHTRIKIEVLMIVDLDHRSNPGSQSVFFSDRDLEVTSRFKQFFTIMIAIESETSHSN